MKKQPPLVTHVKLGKSITIGADVEATVYSNGLGINFTGTPTVSVLFNIGKEEARLVMTEKAWKQLKKGAEISFTNTKAKS